MKSVCLLSHRPDSTRAAFRAYYENNHFRLGARYFPFRKYVRNHLLSSVGEVDFDVLTEFFFDDGVDVAGVHSGRVREILDADEKRFMDQGLIRPAGAEEELLSGCARDIAPAGTRRQLLMLNAATDSASFRDATSAWGRQLAAAHDELQRVSVDYIQNHAASDEGRFPFDAVLSLWLPAEASALQGLSPPAAIELQADVLTEVCESPPELLRELYAPDAF
ncbi:MAG: EthD domain-containing protein [Haliea sp.]|uniref:EthD domain-containing protein n=1 Tax=Haliea sp. TaxID=1932666 RepID=UPI0032EEF76E